MRSGRGGVGQDPPPYARYPAASFSTIPKGIIGSLVERQVGRNAWAVMSALCRTVYADGRLGVVSAEKICEYTGLTRAQVARGMRDLRGCKVIEPVVRRNSKGKRMRDRSSFGHVAQYRIFRDVWKLVDLDDHEIADQEP